MSETLSGFDEPLRNWWRKIHKENVAWNKFTQILSYKAERDGGVNE